MNLLPRCIGSVLATCVLPLSFAQGISAGEETENNLRAVLDTCRMLEARREEAIQAQSWAGVQSFGRAYLEQCRAAVDRFAVSSALEDIAVALLVTGRTQAGSVELDRCLDANAVAPGCLGRKGQVLMVQGRRAEAFSFINKGLQSAYQVREMAERELASLQRPDPRAEQWRRDRYFRMREQVDSRITRMSNSLPLLQDLFDQLSN